MHKILKQFLISLVVLAMGVGIAGVWGLADEDVVWRALTTIALIWGAGLVIGRLTYKPTS